MTGKERNKNERKGNGMPWPGRRRHKKRLHSLSILTVTRRHSVIYDGGKCRASRKTLSDTDLD